MKRTVIKIDEDLCNGCGLCIEGCHEGALQLIDGKARMISDLYCDGLGACIPECPVQAITLEEREAEPYDEVKVMQRISPKGEATIIAHLNHLIDHNQIEFVSQGIQYINDNNLNVDLSKLKNNNKKEATQMKHAQSKTTSSYATEAQKEMASHAHSHGHAHTHGQGGGCPGSRMMTFAPPAASPTVETNGGDQIATGQPSELRQWPVQLHLVNPQAPYFQDADVLLAADCVAFSMGNFHSKYLKGKGLAIACPKLDSGKDIYVEKLTAMIDTANINTLTVMMMEVPCCSGLLQMAKMAVDNATRKVPIKTMIVGLDGQIRKEQWT
jgi:NAD-dependent dihydropyrimidine dehydrogenase PreA subunit